MASSSSRTSTKSADLTANVAVATVLRLVSHGQALLAELLRLGERVPRVFIPDADNTYEAVLFDFRYFKSPEMYEHHVESAPALIALDDELRENNIILLERFLRLFDGIVKYCGDLLRYLEDLQEGMFIQSSIEGVVGDDNGRQLLVEAIFLHGILLLFLDHFVEGPVRERMFVTYYRHKGGIDIANFDGLCNLCRSIPLRSGAPTAGCSSSSANAVASQPPPSNSGLSSLFSSSFKNPTSSWASMVSSLVRISSLASGGSTAHQEPNHGGDTKAHLGASQGLTGSGTRPKSRLSTSILLPIGLEEYISRFPLPKQVIRMIIGRLRTDDVYNQIKHYPDPDHRWVALTSQATCLFMLLFHVPHVLESDMLMMREIVDKFFSRTWVLPIFMGYVVDLSLAWDRYDAACAALESTVTAAAVKAANQLYLSKVPVVMAELEGFLSEGVLTPEFVLHELQLILSSLRESNVTLRWILLHRMTKNARIRDVIRSGASLQAVGVEAIITLLVNTAQLEFIIKRIYSKLLESKAERWHECKVQARECILELAEFFSGSKVLSRKVKDVNLQRWFLLMADQVEALDYAEPIAAGRKVQHMVSALEEVEQLHQIEGSLQTKQYLAETRSHLHALIRTMNVQESVLATIAVISDAAYAWRCLEIYTEHIHARIENDPSTVLKLQCLFLKLRSILDAPLLRIRQCGSEDFPSVSEYYSSKLVAYVRRVLEIIPVNMFSILNDIITVQTERLKEIPTRLERDKLKEHAQLEERFMLAKSTHRVAVFTKGIMAMETTFVGAIELDPRQLLEDGIRKQLVRQICKALDSALYFHSGTAHELKDRLNFLASTLESLRRALEYFQDYVHIHGLRVWQEEFSRVINYYTEQECNIFLKRQVQDWQSAYQSSAIPIPHLYTPGENGKQPVTFVGRLVQEILRLSDPKQTMYLKPLTGWFDADGRELVGLHTFNALQLSVGAVGLAGLDKLLSFLAARLIQKMIRLLRFQAEGGLAEELSRIQGMLHPLEGLPPGAPAIYMEAAGKMSRLWSACLDWIPQIGQTQLLRQQICLQLRASSKIESSSLAYNLEALNKSLLVDITHQLRTKSSESNSTERRVSDLLPELRERLVAFGLHSPMNEILITSPPLKDLALLMFLFTVSQLPRYVMDSRLSTLASRSKKGAVDCTALVVGIVTIFRQFHSNQLSAYMQYMGQYIKVYSSSALSAVFSLEVKKGHNIQLATEVTNAIAWLKDVSRLTSTSFQSLDYYLPPFLVDMGSMYS